MTRNYGIGSRDMLDAARMVLRRARAAGGLSFESVAALSERFALFARFAKAKGIGRMERITRDLVIDYGLGLAAQVRAREMKASYAQNLVSAVNTVLTLASSHRWTAVSPTRECLIPRRSNVRLEAPGGFELGKFDHATQSLDALGQVYTRLIRDFGLRTKEAALLDCNKALAQAQHHQAVVIVCGTKGGKARVIPMISVRQLTTLQAASQMQGANRNMIPAGMSWSRFQSSLLRDWREALQARGIKRLHDLRASYACARYENMTGSAAPVFTQPIMDRELDWKARGLIGRELGHEREDVVCSYVGGRKS